MNDKEITQEFTTATVQLNQQYSIDWNNVILQAITAGLDAVPVIGDLLSHIVFALWPPSGQDIWLEIKQKVEQLVDEEISKAAYDRVASELGSKETSTGLAGVLNNYLGSVNRKNPNGQDPKGTWDAANTFFIGAGSTFQQENYEFLLLPLFAQFANMHLSLLRDGVEQNFVNDSELQTRINNYVGYVQKVYRKAVEDRAVIEMTEKKGFNYMNDFLREMQISVLNFQETWQYFDPIKYKPPVKDIVITAEIYYTITGVTKYGGGNYDTSTLKPAPQANIEKIALHWLQNRSNNNNYIQGTQLTYSNGETTAYSGLLDNGKIPPNNESDPYDGYRWYYLNTIDVNKPIASVQGVYSTNSSVYCANFIFQDGSSTGAFPWQDNQSYPLNYQISPPKGYYLTNIWVPDKTVYYGSVVDMVFGFRWSPVNIDQSTAYALFVSSLQELPLENPRLAPYAAIAEKENWEKQRQQFLAGFNN